MIENRVLVDRYIGDEKIVTDFAHDNAKTTQKLNAPFIPTARSVKRASKALDAKPCKLYRKLVNKASRHLARHRTNAPRNQKQVANSQYERKNSAHHVTACTTCCALQPILDSSKDTWYTTLRKTCLLKVNIGLATTSKTFLFAHVFLK